MTDAGASQREELRVTWGTEDWSGGDNYFLMSYNKQNGTHIYAIQTPGI